MCAMSITKDRVLDLVKLNNQQLNDSFTDWLQDTVGQIKWANEDAADLQLGRLEAETQRAP